MLYRTSKIAVASLVLFAASTVSGQNPAQQRERAGQASSAAQLDETVQGAAIRASKLMGMDIVNNDGKELGEIHDLVVDPQSGKIRYAAVTYGGFLGLGDKLFAVPFEAFQFKPEKDDPSEILLVLDIRQEQLEGAQGFNEDNWPDFANQDFQRQLDERYNVDRNEVDRASRNRELPRR